MNSSKTRLELLFFGSLIAGALGGAFFRPQKADAQQGFPPTTYKSNGTTITPNAFCVNFLGGASYNATTRCDDVTSGGPPSGAAGGDLSGNYPNPTVAKINGTALGSTTATINQILIADGSQWVTKAVTGDLAILSTGAATVGAVQNYAWSNAAPSNGYLPIFNTNIWTPTAVSGDATLANTGVLTLASTIVAGGPIGSATVVPILTYDAKGRLTAVSSTTISGVAPGGSASGDLSGSYPGPTVARVNGTPLGTMTATSGRFTVFDGTNLQSVAMSGDATLASTGAITLASTITAAGPIGGATAVPAITYDAKGRLTTVTSTNIGSLNTSVLTAGTLGVARGGTGQTATGSNGQLARSTGSVFSFTTYTTPTTCATGDIFQGSATNVFSALASVAAGSYLRSAGVTTANVWSTLLLPNAGTTGDTFIATATNTMGVVAAAATGNVPCSAGTSTAWTWCANPTLNTSLTVPLIDTASAVTLNIAQTHASAVNIGSSLSMVTSLSGPLQLPASDQNVLAAANALITIETASNAGTPAKGLAIRPHNGDGAYPINVAALSIQNGYEQSGFTFIPNGVTGGPGSFPVLDMFNAAGTQGVILLSGNTTLNFRSAGGGDTTTLLTNILDLSGSLKAGGHVLVSGTAPTVSSGFGTGASITANNGTAAFRVGVGTTSASTGVIGLPTATTGWNCYCSDVTTTSATVFLCKQTASSTTSATVGNFDAAGSAAAWVDSDVLAVSCFAY